MNFGSFLDCLGNIIWICSPAEVDCNGMLTSSNVDHGRRRCEKRFIFCKIANTKGGRHDNKAQGLEKLE
jgi:hypothetical protein